MSLLLNPFARWRDGPVEPWTMIGLGESKNRGVGESERRGIEDLFLRLLDSPTHKARLTKSSTPPYQNKPKGILF